MTAGSSHGQSDRHNADVIDIEPLIDLQNRLNAGQYATQVVMGVGLLVLLMWLGGRAAFAMAIVYVPLSVLALRGHRVAAVGLFALALSAGTAILVVLGYDALGPERASLASDLSAAREAVRETTQFLFYGGAAVGTVAGWYLVRAIAASIARYRILPPPPLDLVGRLSGWGSALGRFVTRWQTWALFVVGGVAIAPLAFQPIVFVLDLLLFDRPRWSNQITDVPLSLLPFVADLPGWLFLIVASICGLILIVLTVNALATLRRYVTESSAEARRRDTRPPIVLLRSFADDAVTVWPSQGLLLTTTGNTLEHTLEKALRAVRPDSGHRASW